MMRLGLAVVTTVVMAAAVMAAGTTEARSTPIDPALLDRGFLYEIMRHLYRWQLDERDVETEIDRGEFRLWITQHERTLDEGDESRFAEIMLPRIGVAVSLKKSDYTIPELDIEVHDDGYKITNVRRIEPNAGPAPDGTRIARLEYEAMVTDLFLTRALLTPPGDDLLANMRTAAREALTEHLDERGLPFPSGPQELHLGPLSPVSKVAWIYWEEGRMLVRFASDLDLRSPALIEHSDLTVDLFDIDEQTVVTLHEVPGSNAYLTRDFVARVMFNCLVHGKRVIITPEP